LGRRSLASGISIREQKLSARQIAVLSAPSAYSPAVSSPQNPDEVRMTIGEHLDELRSCVVRSLVALVVACVVCIWPAKYLLEYVVARPVILVLRRHGQPDTLLATSPVETLVMYIKVVLFCGVVLAAPYIIYQLWSFVAAGLHQHEKKWVHRLVPWSVGLFLAGATFMYTLVLLVSLNFLIGFSSWIPLPAAEPTGFERLMLGESTPTVPASQPAVGAGPPVPLLLTDPQNPPVGHAWINLNEHKLKIRGTDHTWSVQLGRDDRRGMITTHFRIGEYLSFLFVMTVAFGLAFQLPLVVYFLVRSGIVPAAMFRRYRKVVILLIVFIAGCIAPPDLLSHILLSGPMVLLFEIGLFIAARSQQRSRAPNGAG
jgi:sec-independent protein translocase protein TatC